MLIEERDEANVTTLFGQGLESVITGHHAWALEHWFG